MDFRRMNQYIKKREELTEIDFRTNQYITKSEK